MNPKREESLVLIVVDCSCSPECVTKYDMILIGCQLVSRLSSGWQHETLGRIICSGEGFLSYHSTYLHSLSRSMNRHVDRQPSIKPGVSIVWWQTLVGAMSWVWIRYLMIIDDGSGEDKVAYIR